MLHRKHRPVFDALPDDQARLDRMCELNVQMQVRRLAATPIIEAAWERNQPLHVHGWIYGVHDGLLREVEPPIASLTERDALVTIDQCAREPIEPFSAVRRHAVEAFSGLAATGPEACCCQRKTG